MEKYYAMVEVTTKTGVPIDIAGTLQEKYSKRKL